MRREKEEATMKTAWDTGAMEGLATYPKSQTQLLEPKEERELLQALADCKSKLAKALAQISGVDLPQGADDPTALSRYIAEYAKSSAVSARLGVIHRRYAELRSRLAMANVRLVAHIANRFRDRGLSYSDLLQEGFLGLLEAIDRFDLSHGTKLSTYATWWIRQAIQRAVAEGTYPVRLSPRHLRQLALNQSEIDRPAGKASKRSSGEHKASAEQLRRIHTATQPVISLDANLGSGSDFKLLDTVRDPEDDPTEDFATEETVGRLMEKLQPREQQVLALRFGLGGKPQLSLSQVGKVLDVSKERVRQIQDVAMEKLRTAARRD
jgi:RNA polymerase primary sigma factor